MKKLLITFLTVLLMACSSAGKKSTLDYDTAFDFGKVSYFKTSHQKTDFIYSPESISKLITERMIQKGLKPLESGKADVVFHFMIEFLGEKAGMRLGLGAGTGTGNIGMGISGGIPINKKKVANVQLRVFDDSNQNLIWKYSREVRYKTDDEKKEAIREAIVEMLEEFPPSAKED